MSKLAIDGGVPVRTEILPYSRPTVTEEDKKAVLRVLDSDWLAGNGPTVRAFEEALCEYTGYKYAVAVNSATSALFLAYSTLEQRKVRVPALTFVATLNAYIGNGDYEIVDVDPNTLVADNIEIGVSYAGFPIQYSRVADDAHYLHYSMAEWKNHVYSILSFHAVKPLTTGEGGVVLTDFEYLYRRTRKLSDHGRYQNTGFRFGHNFRMPEINAALGLSQLDRATENLKWRHYIAKRYRDAFNDIDFIRLPPHHEKHAYHLFVLRLDIDRNWFREALLAEGIGTQVHYPPLYNYPQFGQQHKDLPVTEDVWQNGVSIPMFSGMTESDIDDVIDAVRKVADSVWRKSWKQ